MNCNKCGTDTNGVAKDGSPLCAICMLGIGRAERVYLMPSEAEAKRKEWSVEEKRRAVEECIQIRARQGNVDLPIGYSRLYKYAAELGIVVPRLDPALVKRRNPDGSYSVPGA